MEKYLKESKEKGKLFRPLEYEDKFNDEEDGEIEAEEEIEVDPDEELDKSKFKLDQVDKW